MRLPWPWPSATGREFPSSIVSRYLSAYGCAPCMRELSDLNTLQNRYGKNQLVVTALTTYKSKSADAFQYRSICGENPSGDRTRRRRCNDYGRNTRKLWRKWLPSGRDCAARQGPQGYRTSADRQCP